MWYSHAYFWDAWKMPDTGPWPTLEENCLASNLQYAIYSFKVPWVIPLLAFYIIYWNISENIGLMGFILLNRLQSLISVTWPVGYKRHFSNPMVWLLSCISGWFPIQMHQQSISDNWKDAQDVPEVQLHCVYLHFPFFFFFNCITLFILIEALGSHESFTMQLFCFK